MAHLPPIHGSIPGIHAAQQTFHSADGTQAYTVDEYGRGTYWQLPPAPRLPTAAPRGWHYSSERSFPDANHAFVPWSAAPQRTPLNAQHHHEIESQLMLQHQLSKLQNVAPYQPSQQALRHHYEPALDATCYHGTDYRPVRTSMGVPSHLGGATESDWSQYSMPPQSLAHLQATEEAKRATASGAFIPGECNTTQPSWPQPTTFAHSGPLHAPVSSYQMANYAQPQHIEEAATNFYAHEMSQQPFNPSWGQQSVPAASETQHWQYAAPNGMGRKSSWPEQSHQQHYDAETARATDWSQQRRYSLHDAGQQQHSNTQHQIAPEHSSGKEPAPPSPGTLDKSAVPISSFGAEVIWHASSALLEPELLLRAFRDGGESSQGSPGSTSLMTSPMVSTPAHSPRSSIVGAHQFDVPFQQLSHLGLDQFDSDHAGGPFERYASPKQRISGHFARPETKLDSPGREIGRPFARLDPTSDSSLESSGPNTPSPNRDADRYNVLSSRRSDQQTYKTGGRYPSAATQRSSLSQSRNAPARTRSQEQSQSAVQSALRLVSPHWPWTTAADPLPTLLEVSRQSLQAGQRHSRGELDRAPSIASVTTSRSLSPRDGYNSLLTNGDVSPAFRRFAHQVLAQTLLSPTAFLLALLYALRAPMLAIDPSGIVDPEAIEVFASPPSAAPFKLFTLGLMLANKHLDDNTFLNKTWHEVTGIPLAELNKMEQYYLIRSNFEIALPMTVWHSFLCRVKQREESKSAQHAIARMQQHYSMDMSNRKSSSIAPEEASRRLLLCIDDMLMSIERPTSMSSPSHSRSAHRLDPNNSVDEHTRTAPAAGPPFNQRPVHTLLSSHQQCQSAPAPANSLRSTVRDQSCPAELYRLPPRDSTLDRSFSDFGGMHSMQEAPLAPSALLKLLNSGRSFASAHG